MNSTLKSALILMVFYALAMTAFASRLGYFRTGLESEFAEGTLDLLARDKLRVLGDAIRVADRLPRSLGDEMLHETITSVVSGSQYVASVSIVDSTGTVRASDRLRAGTRLPAPSEIFRGPQQPGSVVTLGGSQLLSRDRTLGAPVLRGGRLSGYVQMTLRESVVQGLAHRLSNRLYVEVLLGILAIGLLAFMVQVGLTRRARKLAESVEAAIEGRPVEIPAADDEFAAAFRAAERARLALSQARGESTRNDHRIGALNASLDVGLIWFLPNGSLDFANSRAIELFGAGSFEELRDRWSRMDEQARHVMHSMTRTDSSRSSQAQLALEDSERRLNLKIYQIGTETCDGFIGILTDPQIVETIQGDVHLAGQMQSLARTYRTVVHELRSPLSAIIANMDLLRESFSRTGAHDPALRERQQRYTAVVRNELTRLNHSLFEMLTEVNTYTERMARLDVAKVITDLATLTRQQAKKQGVELKTEVPGHPVPVLGRADRLKQAFLNIVVNALEAMPEGGHLRLVVQRKGSRALVQFHDTGPGVPDGLLERIYEPGGSTKVAGTGTGLYLVQALVLQHGGELRARSGAPRGTIFEIELPLADNGG